MHSVHKHPAPQSNRMTQYILAAAMLLVILAVPAQIALGALIRDGSLFIVTGLITSLLLLPLLMATTATPPVVVGDDGLMVQPVLWKAQFVAWDAIQEVRPYPLLPPTDSETLRKGFVGRRNYQPADGKMLLIPTLPVYYRVTGFFAGAGWTPVIALTNRSHTNYDTLIKQVTRRIRVAE